MKKSILASSIAAAVFGLGAVTGAQASDILLVPYFSAQGANATLLSIINTDTQSGKAVKVRFRGAANSDDVFDFQVFLSPTDVWTANVSRGADGRAVLTTNDASCTKPAASVLNATPFLTSRLDPALSTEAKAAGTREGYIEIINMADIPPSRAVRGDNTLLQTVTAGVTTDVNPLFTAIKHVKSVAPCSGTAYTNLDLASAFNNANYPANLGMRPGTGKLAANWTIVNTVNAAAFGGEARAVSLAGLNGGVNQVTYAPQTGGAVTSIENYTADPLFLPTNIVSVYNATSQALQIGTGVAPAVVAGYYDLPDLSTPLTAAASAANAAAQVVSITTALTASSITNEFAVESAINGSTDWVFSMPSRRYHVAMAYTRTSASDDGRRWNRRINNEAAVGANTAGDNLAGANSVFGRTTSIVNGLICVDATAITPYDREENTPTSSTAVVVSPATVAGTPKLCGETAVLSVNNGTGTSRALEASVAVTAADFTYAAGWATMSNTFPIIGGAFQRAAYGAQGFGVYRPHR